MLLAYSNLAIPASLEFYTARTITDGETLRAHLRQIREQGYALDDEEHQPEVRCLAAPIYDYRGKVIAAMGISGPAARLPAEKLPKQAATVKEVVQALSDRLIFKG